MYPSSELSEKLLPLCEQYAKSIEACREADKKLRLYRKWREDLELSLYDLLNNNGQPIEELIVKIDDQFYFVEVVDFDPPHVRMTAAPMIEPETPSGQTLEDTGNEG